jgi:hypothetical protein
MRHLLILLLSACGGISPAAAAPATGARTCRILFLSAPDNAPKSIFLSDGASVRKVELPSLNFSDIYALGAGEITLRMFSQPPAEGQPLPEQAPKVNVAEAVKDFYLLVASDPSNSIAPLRMQVVDANPENFRAGQMLWFNLSPFTVGGQVGKNSLNMKPNSRFIADAPAAGYEDFPVKLGYVPIPNQQAELLCSTTWRHDPTVRSVVFITIPAGGRAPRVQGFVDSRAKPETP